MKNGSSIINFCLKQLPAVIALLLSSLNFCIAQSPTLPNVISSSSPTAAGLSRYIDFPVSLSNGIPDISIPLYTLTTSKLKVPITVSYHAGGIKVVDRTSTIGLGWTLSAGGCINRVMHGFPDESPTNSTLENGGWLNTVWPAEVPPGQSSNTLSTTDAICVANHLYNSYINPAGPYLWDGEPDIFYFSAPGLGGKFLYRNAPDATGQRAVVLPYQPIKISNPGSPGAPYTITGTDGVVYEFGVGGATDYFNADITASSPYSATTAWYLTKMSSADGTDVVTFKYGGTQLPFNISKLAKYIKTQYHDPFSPPFGPTPLNPEGVGDPAVVTTAANTLTTSEQCTQLTEILSKSAHVIFNYSSLGSFTPLQSIDVYSILNGVEQKIKTYTFSFSQFTGGGANCLRLDAVTETGYQNGVAVSNPPYQIIYATPDAPPYNSKAQDLWGYFNGQLSNTDLTMVTTAGTGSPVQFSAQKRMPDPTSMMKGMIQSIKYPTGGSTTFTFEPNQIITNTTTAVPTNSSVTPGSIFTMGTVPADLTESKTDVTFTMPYPPAGGSVINYTLNFSGHITTGCTPGNGMCTVNSARVRIDDLTSGTTTVDASLTLLEQGLQSTQSVSESFGVFENLTFFPGNQYRIYFVNQGSPSGTSQPLYVLNASITQNMSVYQSQTQQQTVYAGGLRIKKITHTDPVTGNALIKTYNYTQPYFTCPSAFQGDYYSLFSRFFVQSKWSQSPSSIRSEPTDPFLAYTSNIYYLESSAVPVGGAGNSSVAYQQVEEMETSATDGSTLGKTVYTFNKAIDYIPNWIPSIRIDYEDIRKQLLDTKVYKKVGSNFVLAKEVQNTYNNLNNPDPTTPDVDNIKIFLASSSFDFANFSNIPAYDKWSATGCTVFEKDIPISLQPLYYHIGRNFLTSTVETTYDGATPIMDTINYTYGNYAHMQPTLITTKDSKGQLKTEVIKYPLDFANITGTSSNAVGIKNLQALHIITAPVEKSSYLTKLSGVKELTSSVFTTYHPTLPLPLQVSVVESVLPPTNFVAASVVSGDISKDSRYQPRLNFVYDIATGNTLEQQKVNGVKEDYIWGYNNIYPVAKVTGSDYNTAKALVSSTILTSPSSDAALRTELNKLRTGLPNAMVSTYTYLPLIGITSITDPAGRTNYYNYDPFGRLSYIQDQDQKTVKVFGYNYSGQAQSPSLFNLTTFPQSASNTTGTAWNISVTNVATGAIVSYKIANSSVVTNWSNLPAGTYNLSFSPVTTLSTQAQLTFNGTNYYGMSFVLNNMAISTGISLSLSPAPTYAINGSNTTSVAWTVKATNTVTSVVTSFTLSSLSSYHLLGNILPGTYNFLITPNTTITGSQQLVFNGSTYTGTSFSLNAVSVSYAIYLAISPAPISCVITAMSGYTISSKSLSASGSAPGSPVTGYMVFSSSSSMNVSSSYNVGQITGGCNPVANRTFTAYSVGGITWQVTITTTGVIILKNTSATNIDANTSLDVTLSYNL